MSSGYLEARVLRLDVIEEACITDISFKYENYLVA